MDFRQIEAFANVVRYKSFSKAEDASFLTKPTISVHISSFYNVICEIIVILFALKIIPRFGSMRKSYQIVAETGDVFSGASNKTSNLMAPLLLSS